MSGLVPWGRTDWRLLASLAVCAVVGYGAMCAGTFVYDDHHSVADNQALRSLLNVPAYFVDVNLFSNLNNRMYRPVLLSTFALNHAIGGLEPWVYKLTNLLIHASAVVMVFGLARRLGCARTGAVIGSALFGVHPLGSEAVNMISGRSELLLVAALLGGMHCHLSAMRGSRWVNLGTVACAVVACGCKETGVILPVLLAILEGLGAPRLAGWRTAAVRVLPVVAVVLVYLWVRRELFGVATLQVPRMSGGGDPHSGASRDWITQMATMAVVLPKTLWQTIVPVGMSLDPEIHYTNRLGSVPVMLGAALLASLTVVGLWRPRRRPVRALGTCLAWGTALPWVLIPLNVPLSEHRLYGPLAGLALVTATCVPAVTDPLRRRALVGLASVATLVFAVLATDRSLAYRDEKVLWRDCYERNPRSSKACYGIGVCLMREGDLEGARTWMERALEIYPAYVSARKNLAEIHLQLGDRGDPRVALAHAEHVHLLSPRDPFYLLLLSRALAAVGVRTGEAHYFDRAVERALQCNEVADPKGLVYRTAARARREQGDQVAALALLDESIARGLDHVSVVLDRREVLLELGRHEEARKALSRAIAASPFDPRVLSAMMASKSGAAAPR